MWKQLDFSPELSPVFRPRDLGGASFINPVWAAWHCPLFEVQPGWSAGCDTELLGRALPLLWFEPGSAGQELLAAVLQPRGRELAENGANDKETASKRSASPWLLATELA